MLKIVRILTLLCLLPLAASVSAAGPAATVLVFGDSLSAGFGLNAGEGWVDLLRAKLAREGYPQQVINASISGETTAGGRTRIEAALARHQPAIVVLELGANDGLRGTDLKAMRDNLDAIAGAVKRAKAKLVIVGMRLPANYGASYTQSFADAFGEIARKHQAALVPFLFAGLEDGPEYFQADRLHPTAKAQPRLLETVWPTLKPLLGKPARP